VGALYQSTISPLLAACFRKRTFEILIIAEPIVFNLIPVSYIPMIPESITSDRHVRICDASLTPAPSKIRGER
jgi:hypothetical protein